MLAIVRSAMLVGVEGHVLSIEVHVSQGIPCYTVVGLPDTAVRESRERVRAALVSSGLTWPQKRITVNLAPSGLRKQGAGLDLAIALGIALATGELPAGSLEGVGALGELGLDGRLRPVPGTLALVDAMTQAGTAAVLVPAANAAEASLVEGTRVLPAVSLAGARDCLKGEEPWPGFDRPPPAPECGSPPAAWDLGQVRGMAGARRALEVAAAGGHHLLLVGPPGAGKTLLANCLPSILPPLSAEEAVTATKIHSAAGEPTGGALLRARPFRAPHHSASMAALVGGGSGRPRPGEVTLATHGALFLDELGEFPPMALDALRQPLEERVVRIARQGAALTFPADIVLVASTNPCPCGLGVPGCTCTDSVRARYLRRLSAPLLDRFDLRVLVGPAPATADTGPPSTEVRARVAAARDAQAERFRSTAWRHNAHVPGSALPAALPLSAEADEALRHAAGRRNWTGRGLAATHRVARTLADLAGEPDITPAHIAMAAALREEVL